MPWACPIAVVGANTLAGRLLEDLIDFARQNFLVSTAVALLVAYVFALGLGCLDDRSRRRAAADGSEADYREPGPD